MSAAMSDAQSVTSNEVQEIVARARIAQLGWAEVNLDHRAAKLRALGPIALARAEDIAKTIHEETDKPEVEALLAEVLNIADLLDYWTNQAEALLEHADIELDPLSFPGKSGRVLRVPRGVVALFTPYNFPVAIALRHIIPALITGNAVVLKPSETTPRSGELVGTLFSTLLPPHLVQVVTGGPDVGHALIDAGVDSVVFTGGVTSGRSVAHACAERFIPCSLELGGNDPAIVLEDARIERTAQGIVWGAFNNAGQNCASIERVLVVKSVADALIQRIAAITKSLRPDADYGSVTTEKQARIVREQLAEAIDGGAQVVAGGLPDPDSRRIEPTVLRVSDENARLLRDETFGPVLPIVVVDDERKAIELANATPYGLTASVWTKSTRRGRSIAGKLRAGVVTINNHGFTAALPMAPWGGVGHSGHGVTNGPFALDAYTRPLFVLTDRRAAARELWWYPYSDTLRRLALAMARMRGGAGFFGRIAAFFALLVLLPKRLLGR